MVHVFYKLCFSLGHSFPLLQGILYVIVINYIKHIIYFVDLLSIWTSIRELCDFVSLLWDIIPRVLPVLLRTAKSIYTHVCETNLKNWGGGGHTFIEKMYLSVCCSSFSAKVNPLKLTILELSQIWKWGGNVFWHEERIQYGLAFQKIRELLQFLGQSKSFETYNLGTKPNLEMRWQCLLTWRENSIRFSFSKDQGIIIQFRIMVEMDQFLIRLEKYSTKDLRCNCAVHECIIWFLLWLNFITYQLHIHSCIKKNGTVIKKII